MGVTSDALWSDTADTTEVHSRRIVASAPS